MTLTFISTFFTHHSDVLDKVIFVCLSNHFQFHCAHIDWVFLSEIPSQIGSHFKRTNILNDSALSSFWTTYNFTFYYFNLRTTWFNLWLCFLIFILMGISAVNRDLEWKVFERGLDLIRFIYWPCLLKIWQYSFGFISFHFLIPCLRC